MSYAHILGTMYEHSSYYDKGFIIDELMLYHIIYDLYHDPYCFKRGILSFFSCWLAVEKVSCEVLLSVLLQCYDMTVISMMG